jgi:twitching motility protein PilU
LGTIAKNTGIEISQLKVLDIQIATEKGLISYEDTMRSADSENNLRLRIKLEGKAAKGQKDLGSTFEQVEF